MASTNRRQWCIVHGSGRGRLLDDGMPSPKERVNPMFGARLTALRNLAKLDQTEVAVVVLARSSGSLEAKRNRISRLERSVAMPKVWELEEIATFFKVSTDSLLGRTKFEEGTVPQPPKRPRKLPKRERRVPISQRHDAHAE